MHVRWEGLNEFLFYSRALIPQSTLRPLTHHPTQIHYSERGTGISGSVAGIQPNDRMRYLTYGS